MLARGTPGPSTGKAGAAVTTRWRSALLCLYSWPSQLVAGGPRGSVTLHSLLEVISRGARDQPGDHPQHPVQVFAVWAGVLSSLSRSLPELSSLRIIVSNESSSPDNMPILLSHIKTSTQISRAKQFIWKSSTRSWSWSSIANIERDRVSNINISLGDGLIQTDPVELRLRASILNSVPLQSRDGRKSDASFRSEISFQLLVAGMRRGEDIRNVCLRSSARLSSNSKLVLFNVFPSSPH